MRVVTSERANASYALLEALLAENGELSVEALVRLSRLPLASVRWLLYCGKQFRYNEQTRRYGLQEQPKKLPMYFGGIAR